MLRVKTCAKDRGIPRSKGETQLSVSPKVNEEQGFKAWMNGFGTYLRDGCTYRAGPEDGKVSGFLFQGFKLPLEQCSAFSHL